MLLDKPYFLSNKDWYIEDKDIPSFLKGKKYKRRFKLTDKAPKEAVKSYNDYYRMLEGQMDLSKE